MTSPGSGLQNGCAISLYLDLDPSATPTAGEAATRMNALLDEADRSEAARRPDLTHEQSEGLRSDFERIRTFFDQDFDRDGAHGFAVFCAWLDNFWRPLPLSERVPDAVKVGRGACTSRRSCRSSAAARARSSRSSAASAASSTACTRAGWRRSPTTSEEQPGRHDQGGWSQSRYQRHIEKLVHDHLKDVA